MSDDRLGLRTYLTPEEAKEFHKLFMSSFLGFTAVAVVAHALCGRGVPGFRKKSTVTSITFGHNGRPAFWPN